MGIRAGNDEFTKWFNDQLKTQNPGMDSSFSSSARDRKAIYQAPSVCSSCGASISTEDVDWVGPLQLKCPYCGYIMEAEEKNF